MHNKFMNDDKDSVVETAKQRLENPAVKIVPKSFAKENFKEVFTQEILPYYKSLPAQALSSWDSTVINYVQDLAPDSNASAVVIIPGTWEPSMRYAEVMYDLKPLGYSLYAYDQRSMGLSQRGSDDRRKIILDDFFGASGYRVENPIMV